MTEKHTLQELEREPLVEQPSFNEEEYDMVPEYRSIQETSDVESVTNTEKQPSHAEKDPVILMVTGKTGNGKSTALNNIFGLELEARSSPTSVTQIITTKEVKKNGVTLRIVDTPGLGAVGLKTEEIVSKMAAATNGLDFTLLYCLSVKPSDILTETDKTIIKNLQHGLGKAVWDKCVLLLTFSDIARRDEFSSQDQTKKYIAYLKEHAQAFHGLLQECGAEVPEVKTIFDYDSQQVREEQECTGRQIVAIPAKKNKSGEPDIMPGILTDNLDWTNIVFIELMKKTDVKKRIQPIIFTIGDASINVRLKKTVRGGLAGAAVGASIGAVAGIFFNPLGMLIGSFIGAAVGGAVGLPISAIVDIIKKNAQRRSTEQYP